ncbi:MAG: endonuclease/exonuclease/phosphatase family protein [Deltaproteobacteria bacterium]|nr:endonuclease/exonuclease/phosphatase family protein [Deltaproteobacteria bacterium]MBW2445905.1 endonuclease/exonuclease/phosphatase family protein [Deltaproteobacteria bacterium]
MKAQRIESEENTLGTTLRILSANLLAGGADPDAFASLAARLEADVVAVQELGPDQADALSAQFPHGFLDPRLDYDGGGIALARPAEVVTLPLARRRGFRVTLDPDDWPELAMPLEVWNVHVYSPLAFQGGGIFRRRPQFRDLATALDRPTAAPSGRVVVGDFNATPLWPVYRGMAARMEDAARTVAHREGRRPARTWGPRLGGPAFLRIDHGFVAGVRPERFQVVPIEGSDHRAVVLDVAIDDGRFR